MSSLETVVSSDVFGHWAGMAEKRDWLHEIEWTAKYDYNFYDFLSNTLLASNLCFQI